MNDSTIGGRRAQPCERAAESATAHDTGGTGGTWITVGDPGDATVTEERTVKAVFRGHWNDPWAEELCSLPFAPTFPDLR